MATLLSQITDLLSGDITIIEGVIAQLTRDAYITPYENETNFQQFVPILYLNIVQNQIIISDTQDISFSSTDIFTATDWVILNETPV